MSDFSLFLKFWLRQKHLWTQVVLDVVRHWSPCTGDLDIETGIPDQKAIISKMFSRIITYKFLSRLILERLHSNKYFPSPYYTRCRVYTKCRIVWTERTLNLPTPNTFKYASKIGMWQGTWLDVWVRKSYFWASGMKGGPWHVIWVRSPSTDPLTIYSFSKITTTK